MASDSFILEICRRQSTNDLLFSKSHEENQQFSGTSNGSQLPNFVYVSVQSLWRTVQYRCQREEIWRPVSVTEDHSEGQPPRNYRSVLPDTRIQQSYMICIGLYNWVGHARSRHLLLASISCKAECSRKLRRISRPSGSSTASFPTEPKLHILVKIVQ